MVVLVTTVIGLCIWIVLWGVFDIKGSNGIAIVLVMVACAVGLQQILSYLPGRRE